MRAILFLLSLTCNLLFSQNENEINILTNDNHSFFKDSTYIKSTSDKLIIKFSRDNKIESFSISENGINIKLLPNFKHKYNVSIEHDFFAFSFSLPKSWIVKNEEIYSKGKSSGTDFNITLFKNHWITKLFYNETVGYYVQNTNDFIDNWSNSEPYIQLPDAKIKKIGGTTSYLFNAKKISIRAINNQTEIQEKSAGSILATLNYEYNYLYNRDDNINSKQHKYTILPLLEYQYNWVVLNKTLLVAPKLSFGYGYSFMTDYDNVQTKHINSNTSVISFNTNISINYTYKNLFCGIQYHLNNNYFEEGNSKIENNISYNNLYIGYKFNTPNKLKKINSNIKRLL